MKTKIFSYPYIFLATHGKPNSEIGRLKPLKNIQFQIFRCLFKKIGQWKKGLMQIKMPELLSTCHRFLPPWACRFLAAKNNFLQISKGDLFKHQQAHNFFHCRANLAWITKGSRGPLLVLPAFYNDIAISTCMRHLFQGEPLLMVKVLLI